MPSEPWARSRIYGQEGNVALHRVMLDALLDEGYEAIAPVAAAGLGRGRSPHERLGLHLVGAPRGLCQRPGDVRSGGRSHHPERAGRTARVRGGQGGDPCHASPLRQSLRLLPALQLETAVPPAPTAAPWARSTSRAGTRKPAPSISSPAAQNTSSASTASTGYGCGLCQTAVPCESRIPEGLAPRRG